MNKFFYLLMSCLIMATYCQAGRFDHETRSERRYENRDNPSFANRNEAERQDYLHGYDYKYHKDFYHMARFQGYPAYHYDIGPNGGYNDVYYYNQEYYYPYYYEGPVYYGD